MNIDNVEDRKIFIENFIKWYRQKAEEFSDTINKCIADRSNKIKKISDVYVP